MKKLLFAFLLAASAAILYAQQAPPPDLSAGLVAQATYKGWLEGQINSLWNVTGAIPALQTLTVNLPQDEGNIVVLQQQHAADAAAIATLQSNVTMMQQQIAILQQGSPQATPAAVYALGYSKSADRSSPMNLNGAVVSGNAYIYSASLAALGNDNPNGIVSVSYWLDNVNMTGAPLHVESTQPWDFVGGSTTVALPWNSATVTNGVHAITQKVTFSNGTEVDTATFTVSN